MSKPQLRVCVRGSHVEIRTVNVYGSTCINMVNEVLRKLQALGIKVRIADDRVTEEYFMAEPVYETGRADTIRETA